MEQIKNFQHFKKKKVKQETATHLLKKKLNKLSCLYLLPLFQNFL